MLCNIMLAINNIAYYEGDVVRLPFFQESSDLHFFHFRPSIQLRRNSPFKLIVTEHLDHGHIGFQLILDAEEMIYPKKAIGLENPVDIIKYNLHQLRQNPVAQNMHGMNNIQCIIKKW